MARCPDCGKPEITGEKACHRWSGERAVADGGTPPAEGDEGRVAGGNRSADDTETTDDSGQPADGPATGQGPDGSEPVEHDTISRRAMLGYTGGSALATLGVAGAGWYVFFRPTYGPEEEVVREYFDAIDRDHYNTAALLFHEDSPDSPWAADRVTEVSQMDISVEDTEVRERWENAERESVEAYALVVADVEMDSGVESQTFAIGVLVAKNADGEWRIWRDEEKDDSSAVLG